MTKFTKLLDFHKSDLLHNQPSECKLRENTDLSELEDSMQQMQLITSTLIRNLSRHYKKTGLSQRFQNRWDSPKKRWDRVKIPIPAFFFPALQTAGQ